MSKQTIFTPNNERQNIMFSIDSEMDDKSIKGEDSAQLETLR